MMQLRPIVPLFVIISIATIAVSLLIVSLVKKNLRKTKNFRRIGMLVLVALILLRPVFVNGVAEKRNNNLNIYFVVDASPSMQAKDVDSARRIDKVKDDIKEIAEHFLGSRYSVIVRDNMTYTALPLTYNFDSLDSITESLEPKQSSTSDGSKLSELIEYTEKRLTNQKSYRKNRVNIVFFMSDGENNTGDAIYANSSFRHNILSGAVLGYGSDEGAILVDKKTSSNVKILSDTNEENFDTCIKYDGSDTGVSVDKNGCVISKINEINLQKIADGLFLQYYHRESGGISSELFNSIEEKISYSEVNDDTKSYIDTYWILAIILIGLVLWEFYDMLNNILRERNRGKHAKS